MFSFSFPAKAIVPITSVMTLSWSGVYSLITQAADHQKQTIVKREEQ